MGEEGERLMARVTYSNGKLTAYIARLPVKADALAGTVAREIVSDAQQRAPVRTGALRASIAAQRQAAAVWLVVASVSYARFVELGTYKMSPRPYFYPAVLAAAQRLAALAKTELSP